MDNDPNVLVAPTSPAFSVSDDIESIGTDSMHLWFTERHGRRFHSSEAPYFLPADIEEMQRLNTQHTKLKLLLGGNFFGPLAHHLERTHDRRKRVLDLGSGSGIWVEEMAADYPHVKFIGVDLAPTGTREPPDNVQLECYDFLGPDGFRLEDGSVDAVHARSISFGVYDYDRLLEESYRVLLPNGLFLSGEIDLTFGGYQTGGSFISDNMPATRELLSRIHCFAERRGLGQWFDPSGIPDLMARHGFADVHAETRSAPIGGWVTEEPMRTVGNLAQQGAIALADALRPALLEHGGSEAEIDDLLNHAEEELSTFQGASLTYHMVYGRRPVV